MKQTFLFRLFAAAIAATGGNAEGTPVELKSDKLTELQAQFKKAWADMVKLDPLTKEGKDARLATYKIETEMKAETANLQKAELDRKIQEQRNERLKLNQVQLDAFAALNAERAKKTPDTAKVAELETAFNTAKEAVDNELLAKFAHSKPAKASSEGDKTAGNSETSANKAAIIEMFLAGKTQKEIVDAGYKRSTVWHTINNYKIDNSITG